MLAIHWHGQLFGGLGTICHRHSPELGREKVHPVRRDSVYLGAMEFVSYTEGGFDPVLPRFGTLILMANGNEQEVTNLLGRIRNGDDGAKGALLTLTYNELRAIAGHMFRQQDNDHTLQPTALVNELCMRLLRSEAGDWEDRNHFFRAAAVAMRNLLTDHARAKRAARRGGDVVKFSLGTQDVPGDSGRIDVVALDETLERLAAHDIRLGQVFELRFLVGLSVERTAEMLGVSPRTIELDTRFIRVWLHKELNR